jgi:excisionase family DNA binding protein
MLRTKEAGRTQTEPILLSLPEVAAKLCIAVPTLRRWLRDKKLAHVRCGRAVRIESAEISRFIAQNRRPAQDEKADAHLSVTAMRSKQGSQGSY